MVVRGRRRMTTHSFLLSFPSRLNGMKGKVRNSSKKHIYQPIITIHCVLIPSYTTLVNTKNFYDNGRKTWTSFKPKLTFHIGEP